MIMATAFVAHGYPPSLTRFSINGYIKRLLLELCQDSDYLKVVAALYEFYHDSIAEIISAFIEQRCATICVKLLFYLIEHSLRWIGRIISGKSFSFYLLTC